MKDQVRRMAENNEPKCGNCEYWKVPAKGTFGPCERVAIDVVDDKPVWPVTADLFLCSGWDERK